jgi:nitrogenase molybdenum-iron protein beta chain
VAAAEEQKVVQEMWNQPATEVAVPLGLAATDELLMTVSQLSGKPIADALTLSAAGWLT